MNQHDFVVSAYLAVLGRPPELEGLAYWIARMDEGLAPSDLATLMLATEESASRSPWLTENLQTAAAREAFVVGLYEDLFAREPEPEGLGYWSSVLAGHIADPGEVVSYVIHAAQAGGDSSEDKVRLADRLKEVAQFTEAARDTPEDWGTGVMTFQLAGDWLRGAHADASLGDGVAPLQDLAERLDQEGVFGVMGSDEHDRAEYMGIPQVVSVQASWDGSGQASAGSGVLVGENIIMTAAHVVLDTETGRGIADNISIRVDAEVAGGVRGAAEYDVQYAQWYSIETDAGRISQGAASQDSALLALDEAIAGALGSPMELDFDFSAGDVVVTGYPDGGEEQVSVTGSAEAIPAPGGRTLLELDVEGTGPGFSGGPVWYPGDEGPKLVGTVVGSEWGYHLQNDLADIAGFMDDRDIAIAAAWTDYAEVA